MDEPSGTTYRMLKLLLTEEQYDALGSAPETMLYRLVNEYVAANAPEPKL